MEKKLAPITLFVWNRLDHTRKTINALKKNNLAEKSELYIFSDGSKANDNSQPIEDVRKYLETISGFKKITIIKRKNNLGLAKSIISGVSKVLKKHKKIIVLEDDIMTSKHFLEFMNSSLDLYSKDKKVFGVGGYVYPIKKDFKAPFFIKLTNCWGWATWERAWCHFEENGKNSLNEIKTKKLKRKFDIESSYPYLKMLKAQTEGKNNSWAIRWYASIFLEKGIFLYPNKSLVNNIGFDESGTHCEGENFFATKLSKTRIKDSKIPTEENKEARREFRRFFHGIFLKRVKKKLKKITNLHQKQSIYFTGEKLYGDDFSPKQVAEWIKDEREAYANMASDNTQKYQYNEINKYHGYSKLKKSFYAKTLCFGRGNCHEILPIIDKIEKIYAIEPSSSYRAKKLNGKELIYINPQKDGKIKAKDSFFDLITCFGVLHHIPNISFTLKELNRVLKSKGTMLIREPTVSMGDWNKKRFGITKRERGIPFKIFKKIIEEQGFRIIDKTRVMHPLSRRGLGVSKNPFNSKVIVRIDNVLSKLFSYNKKYHATKWYHKLQPQSIFYVLEKK